MLLYTMMEHSCLSTIDVDDEIWDVDNIDEESSLFDVTLRLSLHDVTLRLTQFR